MGTRADFYVGRGQNAEWLGSVGVDGYPDGELSVLGGATSEESYRGAVKELIDSFGEYATSPDQGWPWPWRDSNLTDYAYAFEDGRVLVSTFGSPWFLIGDEEPDEEGTRQDYPDMTSRMAVAEAGTKRSGIIVFRGGGE